MHAHFEPLQPSATVKHYVVRFFEEPVGELDPDTGQPWKPYAAMVVLSVAGGTIGEVKGAVTLPRNALQIIRKLGARQGLRQVHFERWIDGHKRHVVIEIP